MLQNNLPRRCELSVMLTAASFCVLVIFSSSAALAVPYASGISQTGTTVTYVLNEDADSITVKRDVGGDLVLGGGDLLKGTHTFSLVDPNSGFDIEVTKNTAVGWTQINDPTTEVTSQYFSPRGVTVNQDPTSPFFGNIYVSEAIGGFVGDPNGVNRTTLPGIFATTADGSDVYGIGSAGRDGGNFVEFSDGNTNTPNKISVAPDGTIYISGWSDAAPGVWRAPGDLSGVSWPTVLANNGCSASGLCSNHGNIFSVYVEGTGSGTTLYTMDEDYPDETGFFGPSRGDILRYDVGTATDFTGLPTIVVDDGHDPNVNGVDGKIIGNPSDFVRDEDGSWWIAQWRSDDSFSYPTLSRWADDPNASEPLWQSGKEDRVPGDVDWDTDIDGKDFLTLQQNLGLTAGATAFQGDTDGDGDVDSDDLATWEAAYPKQLQQGQLVLQNVHGDLDIHNDLDLIVLGTRFSNGIHVVDISDPNNPVLDENIPHSGSTINDVAFDIAGNIYVVSRSSETLRIYSRGGNLTATTGSDGTFTLTPVGLLASVPEPSTLISWLTFSLLTLFGYRPCREPARYCRGSGSLGKSSSG